MIETYLSTRTHGKSHKMIIHALETIEFIVDALVNKYGVKALYNKNSNIDTYLISGYGLILKLENQLTDSPSPKTVNKHKRFIALLLEQRCIDGNVNPRSDSSY